MYAYKLSTTLAYHAIYDDDDDDDDDDDGHGHGHG